MGANEGNTGVEKERRGYIKIFRPCQLTWCMTEREELFNFPEYMIKWEFSVISMLYTTNNNKFTWLAEILRIKLLLPLISGNWLIKSTLPKKTSFRRFSILVGFMYWTLNEPGTIWIFLYLPSHLILPISLWGNMNVITIYSYHTRIPRFRKAVGKRALNHRLQATLFLSRMEILLKLLD